MDKPRNLLIQSYIAEPPADFTADDLAPELLKQCGIGCNAATKNAAHQAITIKGSQSGWTVARAFVLLVNRWREYRESNKYQEAIRIGFEKFMIEGEYENPGRWGGRARVTETVRSGATENRVSLADAGCGTCGGTGWQESGNGVKRCLCWLAARKKLAANDQAVDRPGTMGQGKNA